MTDEVKTKFDEILNEVLTLTRRGKISWDETSSEDRFIALLENGGIEIESIWDDERPENPHYKVYLLNRKGRVVESASSESPAQIDESLVADLFRMARSNARQSDRVLDEMLHEVHALSKT